MNPPRRPARRTDTDEPARAGCASAGLRAAVCLYCGLLASAGSQADQTPPGWEGQLYGGEYYSDKRLGAYGVASKDLSSRFTVTTELLFERYHNGQGDYDFYGAGAHLLWRATEFARFGLTGSHLHDSYDFDDEFTDPKSEYTTNALGLEGEFTRESLTLAAQAGLADSDYYDDEHPYYAMDAYYWGDQYRWYARGAARHSKGYREVTLEAYRTLWPGDRSLTLYAGATRSDVRTREVFRTSRTQDDTVYTGGFIEFLATRSSRWSLWAEAARSDSDSFYTLELEISFGPGADAPWLSAVDFTP
jgi:hypothetical protein